MNDLEKLRRQLLRREVLELQLKMGLLDWENLDDEALDDMIEGASDFHRLLMAERRGRQ